MQTQQASVNFERQFSCISQSKEKRSDSKTIAAQIAEFEARGGKITPIAIGVSACAPGEILVNDKIDSIATPRLSAAGKKAAQNKAKKHRAPKPAPNIKGLVILQDAAKILGVSPHTVGAWIQKGALKIEKVNTQGKLTKLIKTAAVLALKDTIKKGKN